MPKYRAVVHVSGIAGESPREVRAALGEQLRHSGLPNCQVVSIDIDAPRAAIRRAAEPREGAPETKNSPAWLLLTAATAWAMWFFYWVLSSGAE